MSLPDAHPYDFDPTHGYRLEDLCAVVPDAAVPGFEAFWRRRYLCALDLDPAPRLSAAPPVGRWRVHDVVYASTDGFEIGGWLLEPRDGAVRRGLVVGHGYGGRDQPDYDVPVHETAVLFPCFRGLSRSRRPPISCDPQWHVLNDIEDPDRYILGGCVEDLWLAVGALTRLFPQVAGRVGYSGVSFGGGVGALAMACDPRIDRGCLVVPTFGKMSLWLSLPSVGSARSAQAFVKANTVARATLALFDAATAAARISAPMLTAVARFDPAVAPPCQFAIANALPTSILHERVILDAGHFDYPRQEEQQTRFRERFERHFRAA